MTKEELALRWKAAAENSMALRAAIHLYGEEQAMLIWQLGYAAGRVDQQRMDK